MENNIKITSLSYYSTIINKEANSNPIYKNNFRFYYNYIVLYL